MWRGQKRPVRILAGALGLPRLKIKPTIIFSHPLFSQK
jgi:hypothetical protein